MTMLLLMPGFSVTSPADCSFMIACSLPLPLALIQSEPVSLSAIEELLALMHKIRVMPAMDTFRLLVKTFASAGETKRIRPLIWQMRADPASDHTLPLTDLVSTAVAALAGGGISSNGMGEGGSSSSVVQAVEACILQLKPKAVARASRETREAAQPSAGVAEHGAVTSTSGIQHEGGSESKGMTGMAGVSLNNVQRHQDSGADPRDRRTAEVVRVAEQCGDSSLMSNLLLAYAQAGMTSAVAFVINKHLGIDAAGNRKAGDGVESSSYFPGARQSSGEVQLGGGHGKSGESHTLSRAACVAAAKICIDANLHDVLRRLDKYMIQHSLDRVST